MLKSNMKEVSNVRNSALTESSHFVFYFFFRAKYKCGMPTLIVMRRKRRKKINISKEISHGGQTSQYHQIDISVFSSINHTR
jgi:hypothetical protein